MRALLLTLLLVPAFTFAQVDMPVKQASGILITFDSLALTNAFLLVSRSLVYMGYGIHTADNKRLSIQTKARTFPGGFVRAPISLTILLSFKRLEKGQTEVKLMGLLGPPDQTPTTKVEYRADKGSAWGSAFSRLQEVAKRLSGLSRSQISYESPSNQAIVINPK